jgi:hypothetical protein
MQPEDNRQDDWNCRFSIADIRNSKIENRLHWAAAAAFASFEFRVSSFEYPQSAMKTWSLVAAMPRCHYYVGEYVDAPRVAAGRKNT